MRFARRRLGVALPLVGCCAIVCSHPTSVLAALILSALLTHLVAAGGAVSVGGLGSEAGDGATAHGTMENGLIRRQVAGQRPAR